MPKLKKKDLNIFVVVVFFYWLNFFSLVYNDFFAARLSSFDTYEVITIDNFEEKP
jgi:hypothetical protein